jgi:hypothetical protein
MTIETAILKNVEKLPDSVKQAVFFYTEFLASQYAKGIEKNPEKRRLSGSMKGTFVLPLPDDFDEPLEDFEEYM